MRHSTTSAPSTSARVNWPRAYRLRPLTPATPTALLVLGLLALVLASDVVDFVVFNPDAKTGFEMFLAVGQVFGAVVITLAPDYEPAGRRPWIAASMFGLGLGAFTFGYLVPALISTPEFADSVGHSLFVRSIGMVLLAIGLVPRNPPPLGMSRLVGVLAAGGVLSAAIVAVQSRLPLLVAQDLTLTPDADPGLTAWYMTLNLVPLIAGAAASWFAARRYAEGALEGWIVVAVVLLAGVQLHAAFWPAAYSSVLTTTSLLRLGVTAVILVGGVLSLRNLAAERARLLAAEQDRVQQLENLGRLKRDFSAMVAHELATPLAAVVNLSRMIASGAAPPELAGGAARQIEHEAQALGVLVRDIQESADVERADFAVVLRSVSVAELVDAAHRHARVFADHHPVTVVVDAGGEVLADPDRIGQVLRNLITNAARHTPAGTPITIEATSAGQQVRCTVSDAGPGIDPADRVVILEKFTRGRGASPGGHGLGLYLSQRILAAHGTAMTVVSVPGAGARFSFDLERPA